mmetsp:Transcript_13096/g.29891  ORF Transcript_13096/g.29891 Transcript_13096/m.29891 type:complete len:211 (-) Transcript_13096:2-634(-)
MREAKTRDDEVVEVPKVHRLIRRCRSRAFQVPLHRRVNVRAAELAHLRAEVRGDVHSGEKTLAHSVHARLTQVCFVPVGRKRELDVDLICGARVIPPPRRSFLQVPFVDECLSDVVELRRLVHVEHGCTVIDAHSGIVAIAPRRRAPSWPASHFEEGELRVISHEALDLPCERGAGDTRADDGDAHRRGRLVRRRHGERWRGHGGLGGDV